MKDNFEKPLYEDYKKQKAYRIWGTAVSGGRDYEHADRPLIVLGWMLIILAIGVIGWLNPYSKGYPLETMIVCLILIFLAISFYERKFLYRFGRFNVTWEDETLHSDEEASSRCDKDGKFLKTEENRISARKSRRAFLGLFAGIIAVVLLYCFLWIGLSYYRVLSWHSGEIEEARQIAQKYDYESVYFTGVNGKKEIVKAISEQDEQRLWEIGDSLRWGYVSGISFGCNEVGGYIKINIDTIFGHSKLVWYEDILDISKVKDAADTVTQLDEHWFYLRNDDGRF